MTEAWSAALIVLWIVTLFLGFLMLGALRQIGLIQLRLGADPGALITRAGLDRGAHAPDFEAREAVSGALLRTASAPRVARVLTFVSTSCSTCHELIPHLNEVVATRGREYEFLTICRGTELGCKALAIDTGIATPLLIDEDGKIADSYEVTMTPFVFVVNFEGRVLVRGIANTWMQLESLLSQEGTLEPEEAAISEASH